MRFVILWSNTKNVATVWRIVEKGREFKPEICFFDRGGRASIHPPSTLLWASSGPKDTKREDGQGLMADGAEGVGMTDDRKRGRSRHLCPERPRFFATLRMTSGGIPANKIRGYNEGMRKGIGMTPHLNPLPPRGEERRRALHRSAATTGKIGVALARARSARPAASRHPSGLRRAAPSGLA